MHFNNTPGSVTLRANRLKATRDELSGSTITISSLGPLGGLLSTLIEFGDPADFVIAVEEARTGIASMVTAAALAQNSGEATASLLTYLADQARAERAESSGLDPLDAVVLASQQNAASDGGGDILTAAELTRASALMTGMSAAQHQAFRDYVRILPIAPGP